MVLQARLAASKAGNRRTSPRRTLRLKSTLVFDGEPVTIHDISNTGLLLETGFAWPKGRSWISTCRRSAGRRRPWSGPARATSAAGSTRPCRKRRSVPPSCAIPSGPSIMPQRAGMGGAGSATRVGEAGHRSRSAFLYSQVARDPWRVADALGGDPVGSGSFVKERAPATGAGALLLSYRLRLAAAVDVDVRM